MNNSQIHEVGERGRDNFFLSESAREEEIERLAITIGRLIHEASPEMREELAESANALIREEALPAGNESLTAQEPAQLDARRSRINPLAAGLGLILLGAGMALLLPFLGFALAGIGLIAVIWGMILSWMR